MKDFNVVVLCGGVSAEREVSLRSGAAVSEALSKRFSVRTIDVTEAALPRDMDPKRDVVFSVLHGTFGEDGSMQKLLEDAGFAYTGSDSDSSALCMNKVATKQSVNPYGILLARDFTFDGSIEVPDGGSIAKILGQGEWVVKPVDQGSSVGLFFVDSPDHFDGLRLSFKSGKWLVEERVRGREITVGLLHGRAMGIVEICPKTGTYDYKNKYTAGNTEYFYPAKLPSAVYRKAQVFSEMAFAACRCRDYARADFIVDAAGKLCFLEINTLPGLTATSLLPKSASCEGMDFAALATQMLLPAIYRFQK